MPKVSFLVSNYKTQPEILKTALDSMLSQTFKDFDIIIIDDGSADESLDLLREYAEKNDKIKLLENEKNIGLHRSLNRGLDVCTSEYVARMDTDDICLPDRLEKQVAFMDSHPELLFSGAWADFFDDDPDKPFYELLDEINSSEEYAIRLIFANVPTVMHPTAILRKKGFDQYGLRYLEDEKHRFAQDYCLWARSIRYGKADILHEKVLKYRENKRENRIHFTHQDRAHICSEEVRRMQFKWLHIDPSDELMETSYYFLNKELIYDLKYKKMMDLLLKQNRKYRIYDQKTMRYLFEETWLKLTYKAVIYENDKIKRLKYAANLFPGNYIPFAKMIFKKMKSNYSSEK